MWEVEKGIMEHDTTSMQLTPNKFDGTNYAAWCPFVKLYVTGKGQLGYLTGERSKPGKLQLFHFLISDPGLDHLRNQVLAEKPLPNIREAHAFIRREDMKLPCWHMQCRTLQPQLVQFLVPDPDL